MASVAVAELKQSSPRTTLLDWMEQQFDGDPDAVVEKAIVYVKRHNLARGPLWDEIAATTLRQMFLQHRVRLVRNNWAFEREGHFSPDTHASVASPSVARDFVGQSWSDAQVAAADTKGEEASAVKVATFDVQPMDVLNDSHARASTHPIYVKWYHLNGRYYNLGDLTRGELSQIAVFYDGRSKANAYERDFLIKLAEGLADDAQTVQDRYKPDEILWIRSQSSA